MIAEADAHLVLIPKVAGSILSSASSLYQPLCYLRDTLTLMMDQHCLVPEERLSWMHPLCPHSGMAQLMSLMQL